MTTDYRALCVEILQKLDQYEDGQRVDWDAWRETTRAALAQSEPQGPTDEEICSFIARVWPHSPGEMHDCEWRAGMMMMIHAAIEELFLPRWGRPAIEPVPVAERLPGSEDCNAEGECWWWDDDDDKWVLHDSKIYLLCWTHWLPHHALPIPATEAPS
jgi:hypothetical protein